MRALQVRGDGDDRSQLDGAPINKVYPTIPNKVYPSEASTDKRLAFWKGGCTEAGR